MLSMRLTGSFASRTWTEKRRNGGADVEKISSAGQYGRNVRKQSALSHLASTLRLCPSGRPSLYESIGLVFGYGHLSEAAIKHGLELAFGKGRPFLF